MLKNLAISICIISIAVVVYFYIIGRVSQSQPARQIAAEFLSKCPDTPNCVCSEYEQDTKHFIAPIKLSDFAVLDGNDFLTQIIADLGGEIAVEQEDYLSATFKSGILGFVDDFEVRVDQLDQKIHLRSASRVGRSDFGANKKRVERFKQVLSDRMINR